MKKLLASLLAAPVVMFVAAAPAQAQATRTWVSGVGDDVNPCSRTAPCKTFAGAISKTAINGEINCLDPGGFGTLNITKSITIDCGPYTMGSMLAANTNGVIVNAAGIVVTLRGLRINGASTTTGNGVRILNAAAVTIDDVVIENFGGTGTNGRGVTIETSAANVRVYIQNSRLQNINNFGIDSNPIAGNVILVIDDVQMTRGGNTGVLLRANTTGRLNQVSINAHVNAAVTLQATSNNAHISNSFFTNNSFGVFNGDAGGAPTTRLFGTVITGSSSAALQINGGSVFSYGNNAIRGNTGNEAPTGAVLGTQ